MAGADWSAIGVDSQEPSSYMGSEMGWIQKPIAGCEIVALWLSVALLFRDSSSRNHRNKKSFRQPKTDSLSEGIDQLFLGPTK